MGKAFVTEPIEHTFASFPQTLVIANGLTTKTVNPTRKKTIAQQMHIMGACDANTMRLREDCSFSLYLSASSILME